MEYGQEEIQQVVLAQRDFFRTGQTLDVKWRIAQLKRLRCAVLSYEQAALRGVVL